MMGLALAAAGAVGLAGSNVAARVASTRTASVTATAIASAAAAAVGGVLWLVSGGDVAPRSVLLACASGVCSGAALLSVYRALSLLPVGVAVVVMATTSTTVQAGIGWAVDGRPGAATLLALALVLGGGAVVAIPSDRAEGAGPAAGVLAAVAGGALFGLTIPLFGLADGPAAATVAIGKATALVVVVAFAAVAARGSRPGPARGALLWAVLAGALDTLGNVSFVLALGATSLVAVATFSAAIPTASAVTARVALKERLSGRQWTGVAVVLAGTLLMAISGLAAPEAVPGGAAP
jgi:drug/metabolite transporter (DMT)-like permease